MPPNLQGQESIIALPCWPNSLYSHFVVREERFLVSLYTSYLHMYKIDQKNNLLERCIGNMNNSLYTLSSLALYDTCVTSRNIEIRPFARLRYKQPLFAFTISPKSLATWIPLVSPLQLLPSPCTLNELSECNASLLARYRVPERKEQLFRKQLHASFCH